MAIEGGQQGGGQAQGGGGAPAGGGASGTGGAPGGGSQGGGQLDETALSNLVNSAVTGHLKRTLPKALEEALAPIRERLSGGGQGGRGGGGAGEGPAGEGPAGEGPAGHGGAGQRSNRGEGDERLSRLEAELKTEREARAKERQEAREKDAFAALRIELKDKVRPEAIDQVAKLLFKAEGFVRVQKDGTVVFEIDGEEMTLAEGVAAWLKKPDAAVFQPPPGNGSRKPTRTRAPGRLPGGNGGGGHQRPMSPAEKTLADLQRLGIDRIGGA